MIKKVVDRWVDYMIENGADEKQRQIYSYGMECTVNEIVSDILLLVCAYFLGRIWEMAVWIIVFNILRVNVGGYHASTPFRCIAGSTILGILCTLVYPVFVERWGLGLGVSIICICIAIKIAPVLNIKHPVTEYRRQFARKLAILITMLMALIAFFIHWLQRELSAMIQISMCSVYILSVAGYWKSKQK